HPGDRAGLRCGCRAASEDAQAPLAGLGESEQHVEGGRLAGAVGAEQRDDLAAAAADIDAVYGLHRALAESEAIADAAQPDGCARRDVRSRLGGCGRRRWGSRRCGCRPRLGSSCRLLASSLAARASPTPEGVVTTSA